MKKRDIKAIALALGVSLSSMLLTSCTESEYEHSVLFESILDDTKEDTLLDEILREEENKEKIQNMLILEKYLSFSEKIHTLGLDKASTESKGDEEEILSIEEIDKYLEKYESLVSNDPEYESTTQLLKKNGTYINEWLYQYGYLTTASMATLVAKAKLVDLFSLEAKEYKNFNILENPDDFHVYGSFVKVKYIDPNSKCEYYYDLKTSNDSDDFVSDLTNCCENKLAQLVYVVDQSKKLDLENETTEGLYNEELNQKLNLFMGVIKSSMYAKFRLNDGGQIEQYPENNEVNNIYKQKMKSLNERSKNLEKS